MATTNTCYLSAVFNASQQLVNPANAPLANGFIYTYIGGTTTPAPTYTTVTGQVTNPNPIVLDVNGRVPNEIWLDGGLTPYKFLLTDSANNVIPGYPKDQLPGINQIPAVNVAITGGNFINVSNTLVVSVNIPQTIPEAAVAVTPTFYFYEPGDVRRYGADPTGTSDSATAFTNACAAYGDVYVYDGIYLLNSGPHFQTSILHIAANVSFTGTGNTSLVNSLLAGSTYQFGQYNTANNDFYTVHVVRNANHTGGTPGFVNAGFRVDHNVGSSVSNYEWAIVGVMNNNTANQLGNQVAVYGQGNKANVNSGATWAGVMEARETVPITDPQTGLIGLEVDMRTNGTDNNTNRVGIDLVCVKYNTAATAANTVATFGYRLQNGQDPNSSNSQVSFGFSVFKANVVWGFDTATSTVQSGAIRMAQNQSIAFDILGNNQILFDGSGIEYTGNTGAARYTTHRLCANGNFQWGGASGSQPPFQLTSNNATGTATPSLSGNKPGSNGGTVGWVGIYLNGSLGWIPVFSN